MRVARHILTVALAIALNTPALADMANAVKAVVGDTVITHQQVEIRAGPALDLLRRQYARQPEKYRQQAAIVFSNALEQLVDRQLILADFKAAGYNLPESIIDEAIKDRIRERFGDRANLTKQLQAEGRTYDQFRQQIREQIIEEALTMRNVSSEIIMSPHKIETYYLAHTNDYQLEDQVHLRMIVLDSSAAPTEDGRKKLAQEILGKINDNATFIEMASLYSSGSQRRQGGDWGWKERSQMDPGLAAVAFGLKAGQHSGMISRAGTERDYWICEYDATGQPVRARHFVVAPGSKKESLVEEKEFTAAAGATDLPPPNEFYLMFVEELKPAHNKPISEVRDEIEKTLLLEERARLRKVWIDRLKAKTFVRYF